MHRAFTYTELLIVAAVMAIATVGALPDSNAGAKEQGRQAARLLEADISYARSLSIARPLDPAVIKVDPANNRYWIARAGAPTDMPVAHPVTQRDYLVQFGVNATPVFKHVEIEACDLGGDQVLAFTPLGGTDQNTPAFIQFVADETGFQVEVPQNATEIVVQEGDLLDLGR